MKNVQIPHELYEQLIVYFFQREELPQDVLDRLTADIMKGLIRKQRAIDRRDRYAQELHNQQKQEEEETI